MELIFLRHAFTGDLYLGPEQVICERIGLCGALANNIFSYRIPVITSIRGSVISSIAERMPSRPSPESLTPP